MKSHDNSPINLVTKQASMPGGELVVNGTLIIDHIYDLKKLTLCGTDALLISLMALKKFSVKKVF